MPRYSVSQHPISTILSWINSKAIAVPEIQRPFVWETTKIRDLLDSLYQGYPIGYIITWKNPDVRLKDGSLSQGKLILIDGQQRITAIRAAILGEPILDKNYKQKKVSIAYNPQTEAFETTTPAIARDPSWISDISQVMKDDGRIYSTVVDYCKKNPGVSEKLIGSRIEHLVGIKGNLIGFIELDANLDIDTVTEIFIRVNSQGVELSQADFAMSKIASYDVDNFGVNLRKCIDYFCHLTKEPHFYTHIQENDTEFAQTDYLSKIAWLKNEKDDLYDPGYSDVLRVAFPIQFNRGKLGDLVSLLSGRNFETKEYEQKIVESTFEKLKLGVLDFIHETHFKRFVMIIKSAGFISPKLISSQNALNMAYVVYLHLRRKHMKPGLIESFVKRWFVMSLLTGRYSSSPESQMDHDIRQLNEIGIETYLAQIESGQLSETFWDVELVQGLERSIISNPLIRVFFASQVQEGTKGFLSKDISVASLIEHSGDVHHLFPKEYLKQHNFNRYQYNQIANFAWAQEEINIQIGKKSPEDYMGEVLNQCTTKKPVYGNITSRKDLLENLSVHCVPEDIFSMRFEEYESFLERRRKLIAQRLKSYYERFSKITDEESADIESILKKGETNHTEFKPAFRAVNDSEKPQRAIEFEIAKSIAAFANTDGGTLVIGVSDHGDAIGLDEDYKLVKEHSRDGFLLALDDFVGNYFGKDFHKTVQPEIEQVDGKDICVVVVHKSSAPVFVQKDGKEEFYIRASASTRFLNPSEMIQYIQQHWK